MEWQHLLDICLWIIIMGVLHTVYTYTILKQVHEHGAIWLKCKLALGLVEGWRGHQSLAAILYNKSYLQRPKMNNSHGQFFQTTSPLNRPPHIKYTDCTNNVQYINFVNYIIPIINMGVCRTRINEMVSFWSECAQASAQSPRWIPLAGLLIILALSSLIRRLTSN